MKRSIAILLTILSVNLYAQNVGISGDPAFIPDRVLDVDGTLQVTGEIRIGENSATNNDIYISNRIIDWDNASFYLDPASISRVNEINFSDGSQTDPSIWFDGDSNTGLFQPANNQIALSINGSEEIRVDDNGNVGISTSTPIAKLHVLQNTAASTAIISEVSVSSPYNALEGGINNSNISYSPSGVLGFSLYTGTGAIRNRGVTGIANNWRGYGVLGFRVNNGGTDDGWGGLFLNDLGYTGALLNASDRKIKTDIQGIDPQIENLMNIKIVSYRFKEEYREYGFSNEVQFGLIAQDLQKIFPSMVKNKHLPSKSGDGMNIYMVDYVKLIPILIKSVQEQQKQIEEMRSLID